MLSVLCVDIFCHILTIVKYIKVFRVAHILTLRLFCACVAKAALISI